MTRGRSPLTTLGLVAVSAGLLAAAALMLIVVGLMGSCATAQPKLYTELPPPTRAREAMLVAHAILDNAPGWVRIRDTMLVRFVEPNCRAPSGQEGMAVAFGGATSSVGSCIGGATGNSINAVIVWPRGMTLADSALAHEMFHMWEFWRFGIGDVNHSGPRWAPGGPAWAKIAEIQAALRAAGM